MDEAREMGPAAAPQSVNVDAPSRQEALRWRERRGRGQFEIGQVIGRSFATWARHFLIYATLTIVVFLPYVALRTWANFFEREVRGRTWYVLTDFFVQQILSFVLAATVIYAVFQHLRGRRPALGACLSNGFERLLPVVGTTIAQGIAFVAPVLPGLLLVGLGGAAEDGAGWAALGLLLLVVGLVFMAVIYLGLFVALPVCVVEKPGVFASLKRSWMLTRGYKWSIFFLILIFGVLNAVVTGIVAGMAVLVLGMETLWIVLTIAVVFLSSLTAVANAVTYHDLRVAKEGIGTEELAAIFD